MEKTYSFKKGIAKALVSLLSIAGSFVAMSAFADFTLWQLLETYLKPVLGGITFGGLITLGINYLNVRYIKR